MHRTTLSLLWLLAPACFDEAPSSGDESDGATSGDSDDTASDGDDGSSGEDSDDSDSDDGSSGADSDDSDDATGAGDGYPEEVTDVLDLPWPPDNYADPDLPDHFLTDPVTDLDNTPADPVLGNTGAA